MNKFKNGDRVKGWVGGQDGRLRNGYWAEGIFVRHHNTPDISFVRIERTNNPAWRPSSEVAFWSVNMDLLSLPIDPARVRLRRGGPAVTVDRTGDDERPYRATVDTELGPLTLTYDKYGQFYPNFEQPIDLVSC